MRSYNLSNLLLDPLRDHSLIGLRRVKERQHGEHSVPDSIIDTLHKAFPIHEAGSAFQIALLTCPDLQNKGTSVAPTHDLDFLPVPLILVFGNGRYRT